MEKENQIPQEKDFNLSKVKIQPNGELKAVYQVTQTINGELSLIDREETCNREVHPDLKGLFKDLRNVVGRVFNVTSFLTLLESDDFKLTESKKEKAREFAQTILDKIDVRGVSWSGSDENVGVVITAIFETPNGLKTCINTPRIRLSQVSFGFEEELESICNNIKTEVYQFLFQGKQAQLSLFGEQNENPENENG